ncbi:Zinc-finger homeodomain protein 8 [Camellia lanceoleosa]|uniref:Zinc-finger homeodomain protein 8 n=1 Tax=Camellia lanceoleosa TaxID=1840588 RepID=A0ACC0IR55_9ERIC|nr:Zinc-finger homeodomain protein 8 [Camellia lanceoleosa]
MANNNGHCGIRCATIVLYRECQRNNATDGCNHFLNAVVEKSHPSVTFYCAACGCHRNLHHVEEVLVQLDPTVVGVLHSMHTASTLSSPSSTTTTTTSGFR